MGLDALPDDRAGDVLADYTITDGDWTYRKDRYGDWRGTHAAGRLRTRLKGTIAWAKHDVGIARLQRRGTEGWNDIRHD